MAAKRNPVRFEHASAMPASVADLWNFHQRPDALELLAPPLLGFEVEDRGDGVADGSVIRMVVGRRPFRQRWTAIHASVESERAFVDVALEAPFPYWVHQHLFEARGESRSRLSDVVWFVPPRWLPGKIGRLLSRAGLRVLFWWRHRVTKRSLTDKYEKTSRCGHGLWPAATGGNA
jgi:ligand-binding SRPBCC domain-containing protein